MTGESPPKKKEVDLQTLRGRGSQARKELSEAIQASADETQRRISQFSVDRGAKTAGDSRRTPRKKDRAGPPTTVLLDNAREEKPRKKEAITDRSVREAK